MQTGAVMFFLSDKNLLGRYLFTMSLKQLLQRKQFEVT